MSYPDAWEADVLLADGGTLHVRPIVPDDADRIAAFHGRQSAENIYYRYFSPRPSLSERDLANLTHVDYVDRVAFVGLLGDDLVGVARYDRYPMSSIAEVAFFTDGAHQGRGLATVLLEYLAAAAREVGLTGFNAQVLPQNRRMLSVFKQAGFEVSSRFADGVIEVELGIEPTPEALAVIEGRARAAFAQSVRRLLAPRSVAVVGASRHPGSIGYEVFRRLLDGRFEGPVYPVNADASHVASVRAYPSLLDVPDHVDLAVVCVPAEQVSAVVDDCAHKRVHGLVIISAGFSESGPDGARLEQEVVDRAHRHGMRVVGPNSMGVVNTAADVSLDATFVGVRPLAGRIGVSSQSGTLGAAIIGHARRFGLGISTFVSVGNKPDVSGNDLLQYWEDDDATDVVLLHLESFGNPRNFARITRRLTRVKPVVAVKSGRAVALDRLDPDGWPVETSLDALLSQTGVIRVDTLEQLFDVARLLVDQPVPKGRRVAVVSNSWGPAVLAADACIGAGLVLAAYEAATEKALTSLVSHGDTPIGIRTNPIDLGYRAGVDEFRSALNAVLADPGVDAVVVLCTPPVPAAVDDIADVIADLAEASEVTVVATFLGLASHSTASPGHRRVPVFEFPEAAAHALSRVARYGEWRAQEVGEVPELDEALLDGIRTRVDELLVRDGPGWLTPADASELLERFGLPLVERAFVYSADEAVDAARRIGHPVAIKATGLARPAKTEAGGVAVDVHGDSEVRDAFARMSAMHGDAMQPAVVQAMAPGGIDGTISVHQDASIGSVVTLGAATGMPESGRDLAVRVLPLTDLDAGRLVAASLLAGELDRAGLEASSALEALLLRLAAVADAVPELALVDLAPVLVSDKGAFITDVRVRLAPWETRAPAIVRRLDASD
jgi:acyl-CoA synthetase (NDP forming)/RimJ/RimL family protein N-acetyltransferase